MVEDITGKTLRVLDLMLTFFADERRWCKGHYYDHGSNRHCLVGAATHFSATLGLPYDPVISLLQAALPQRQMGLVTFNDDHCRTIDELRAVIRKALTFALEITEHERAAAAFQRRFMAELEQERAARRAAGDSRQTYILCSRAPDEPSAAQRLAA